MASYKKDYSMSDDKIYSKFGKIVTMLDDLQTTGCFDPSFTPPVYRIVVTGPNFSGKDSFINCLLGAPFLPPNCRSKRQMDIRITHSIDDVSPMVHVEEMGKKYTQFSDCSRAIADLQKTATDSNLNTPIRMNFITNTSADLYIISTAEQEPSNLYAPGMLRDALSPSSNFIILVLEAMTVNDDRKHIRDQWFDTIKSFDPNLSRTLVVFTKCDIIPNNFNYNKIKQYLRESNEIFSPQYGFVCVKANFASHIEPSDQVRLEREYFCNHKVFQFLPINDYFTFDTVGEKITKWIYETNDFKKTLIDAYAKLQDRLKFVEGELQKFGNEFLDFTSQSKDLYLQSMMNIFCETVEKTFSGKSEIEEYNLANTALNKTYVDFLCEFIDVKPSEGFKNKDIIETLQRTEGSGLGGFPSGDVIYSLLDKKFEELRNELGDFMDRIYVNVQQLFKNIIMRYFSRFPKALTSIEELILSFFEQEFNKVKKLETDISEMNFTFLYVDEKCDQYKQIIQNNFLKKGYISTNSLNENQNNAGFKDKKDISFFKSVKDPDSYYQGLADYVKSLVDFIYSEIIRNLREYVPKTAAHFFIKSLKNNMRFYLLQYLSRNPEFSQELEEDQDIAQKRTFYIDAQKKLKRINKNISCDDQITKIVKGDNLKNIDNILQAQGIPASNPKEEQETNPPPKPANTNIFGEGQKKDNKPPSSNAAKNNLFGNTSTTGSSSKANNLFGTNNNTQTSKNTNTNPLASTNPTNNNLFGNNNNNKQQQTNTKTQTNKTQQNNPLINDKKTTGSNNNLFGPNKSTSSKSNNLFGPPQNQPPQQNKGLNVNLKLDPKTGGVAVDSISGNIDAKDAYNLYQQNKQYMPSGQQMLSGAMKVNNMMNQNQGNNTNKSKGGLANLFGTGKK